MYFEFNFCINLKSLSLDNYCNPPTPDCQIPLKKSFGENHPNDLPPQADKMFRIMANMRSELDQLNSALEDSMAGTRIGYLDASPNRPFPPVKNPFPVWTPTRN